MSATVFVSPQASDQVKTLDEWWRVHREAAPELFSQEFAEASSLLANVPELGHRILHPTVRGLRRLLLRATRYQLYYVYGRRTEVVTILAVWSQLRGSKPKLSK